MSDDSRHHDGRLPEFHLPPAVKGHQIDPDVRDVAERLWPWAWHYIGTLLADYAAAAEIAALVAYRISRHLELHPGEVRSIVGLYYTTTANLVKSSRSHDGRLTTPAWDKISKLLPWLTSLTGDIDGRIAILVNQHTKSAAEMVADSAITHQLATIVGTRTAGEVLGAANFLVGEDYRLRIPIGGWMTWDDRLLEGRGVQPDVEVVPTPSEIGAGKDLALSESVGLIAN